MIADGISFPNRVPSAYRILEQEPVFDPARHLALERPAQIEPLEAFGYDEVDRANAPSNLGLTAPFRVLSDEGVAALRQVADAFRTVDNTTEGDPAAAYVKPRGVTYSSAFARDLASSPDLVDFLSRIADAPLAAHTMPTLSAGFIFAPPKPEDTNQGWHLDSLGFTLVLMVSDPDLVDGGAFQYFLGNRREIAGMVGAKDPSELRTSVGRLGDLPANRVRTVPYPAAGYGMFMQGNLVLHRGEPLKQPGDRDLFVPGFIARDMRYEDTTNWPEIKKWNSPAISQEYVRHKAWRARAKLDAVISELPFDGDAEAFKAVFAEAAAEINEAQRELDERTEALDTPAR